MDQIRVKVGAADHFQEKAVLDGIEGLADVDSDRGCPERRFSFVEARRDSSDGREESSGSGVAGTESMLGRRRRERRGEKGKDQTLKDFRGGAQEGDGAIRGRREGRFTGLRDGNYKGLFPNGGKVRVFYREVKEGGEK